MRFFHSMREIEDLSSDLPTQLVCLDFLIVSLLKAHGGFAAG